LALYSYKKKKGHYRIVVWIRGKRTDRIVEATRAQAQEIEAQLLLRLSAPAPEKNVLPTLESFCRDEYWPHAQRRVRKSTLARKKSHLVHVMAELGHVRLDEFTTKVIEDYAIARRDDGLQAVSVNNEVRTLLRVLNFAAHERDLPIRVPKFQRLSEAGREKVTAYVDDEVQQLLVQLEKLSKPLVPLVLFILNTGARRGEAMAMKSENVDLDRGVFRIWSYRKTDPRTGEVTEQWTSKNGKSREVPISKAMLPYLTKERLANEWLFPSPETGERYAHWPQRMFDRARDAAGINGGVHKLRHTFASRFLAANSDMFLLARILGHSYTQVTERYSHLQPGHLDKARNVVSIAMPKSKKKAGKKPPKSPNPRKGRRTR
jgi:integrase